MKRLANFMQNQVCDVRNVIDGSLPDCFEALHQPCRRRRDLYPSNNPCCVSRTQDGILYFNTGEVLGPALALMYFGVRNLHSGVFNYRNFTRNTDMRQTVRPIRRDLDVEHVVAINLLNSIDSQPNHRQTLPCLQRSQRRAG